MRRLVVGGTFCLLVCIGLGVAFWQWWHWNQKPIPALRLAAGDAIVYTEVRDVGSAYKRWRATSLAGILAEPSVQQFLAHPAGKVFHDYKATRETVARLRPSSFFFFRTDYNRQSWVAGIRCSSDLSRWRDEVQELLQNSCGYRLLELPVQAAGEKRETVVSDRPGHRTVFGLRLANWLLLGQNPEMLRACAERGRQARAGLEESALFQKCMSQVPSMSDFLTYFKGSVLSQPGLPWKAPAEVANVEAVVAATSFDGPRIRDTVFTCEKVPGKPGSLERRSIGLAGPNPLFYGAFRLNLLKLRAVAHTLASKWSIAETLQSYLDEATSSGFNLEEVSQLLESVELILNRDPSSDNLSFILTATTRDPVRFREFADRLMKAKFSGQWTRTEIEGVKAYVLRANEAVSLVIGVYGRQLYIATSGSAFGEALRRARAQDRPLEQNEQYRNTVALVAPPTEAFAYLDTKGVFERVYPMARPMIVFGSAFIPTLAEYVDPTTFPGTDEIARHLSPIVFSRRRIEYGVLDESVGPVTAYQASIVALGVCGALGLFQEGE